MQNDEYYDLYMKEWEKILKQTPTVDDAERNELRRLIDERKSMDDDREENP